MPPELGEGQAVTQAVVMPQTDFDRNTAPMLVTLFKPDVTPFLSDTASVYTVYSIIASPCDDELWAYFTEFPSNAPYPYRSVIYNQSVPERNGIYQNMTGAPGTVGNQLPRKVSGMPEGESLFVAPFYFVVDGELNLENMVPSVQRGGFMVAGVLIDNQGTPEYDPELIYDGHMIKTKLDTLQTDLTVLEERVTALEGP